jgi:hypothetical protein
MKAQDKPGGQRRPLSDRQWDKIRRASGLPSEARSSIELDVRAYSTLYEGGSGVPPAKIRGKLRKLRNQAKELLKSFEEALGHDDVYLALVPVGSNEWHPRNLEQRKRLAEHYRTEKAKAELNDLIDWLEKRERALSRRKPGPSAEQADNVYLFVDLFGNALHHYTNKRLTRSDHHRKMMEEIFAIVDRNVGKGTIDTAMRRVCAARRSRRGLLPGSRV